MTYRLVTVRYMHDVRTQVESDVRHERDQRRRRQQACRPVDGDVQRSDRADDEVRRRFVRYFVEAGVTVE